MRALRIALVLLAILPGVWMAFDGARALITGDYVTPRSGPYAGQLGPWARLVQAVGIPPRSTLMKAVFVLLGLAWLVSAFMFATRQARGHRYLAATAIASLWYLPVGTAIAAAELGGLAVLRARGID
jgi:hypothetical protein